MRNILGFRVSAWIALLAMLLLAGGAAAAAQREHKTTKVAAGQKGDVTFTTEMTIAGTTLKPGRYYIEHRVEGAVLPRTVAAHYVHFTEVTAEEHQKRQGAREAIGEYTVAHPGEIQCEFEALTKKASKTTVFTTTENGIRRITRIEIAGENVAHIF
jgi:hypothetical protein